MDELLLFISIGVGLVAMAANRIVQMNRLKYDRIQMELKRQQYEADMKVLGVMLKYARKFNTKTHYVEEVNK